MQSGAQNETVKSYATEQPRKPGPEELPVSLLGTFEVYGVFSAMVNTNCMVG